MAPTSKDQPTSERLGRSIGIQTDPIPCFSQPFEPEPAVVKAAFQELLGVAPPNDTSNSLEGTFYQKELPASLIRFASPEGKKLFREAMDSGHAEGFFPLTGNFTTQSEPAYCGPSSLAMVLNALEVDPKRRWKGNWRWYSDELLHCCTSQEDVKKNGITFDNFACLAECYSNVETFRGTEFSFEKFKKDVEMITSTSDKFMVISFSRKVLGQTGDGHFSPIGAYNLEEEKVLILDTARYKYPSYWCPIKTLFESMSPVDIETGRPRGYFLLSYDVNNPPLSLCNLRKSGNQSPDNHCKSSSNNSSPTRETPADSKLNWSTIAKSFCCRIPENMWLEKPKTIEHLVPLVLRNIPKEYPTILASQSLHFFNITTPHKAEEYINQLLYDTSKSPLYPTVLNSLYPNRQNQSYLPIDCNAAFATLFILSSPRMLYVSLPKELQDRIDHCRKDDAMTLIMKQEINRISEEITDLTTNFCTCGPGWSSRSTDASCCDLKL